MTGGFIDEIFVKAHDKCWLVQLFGRLFPAAAAASDIMIVHRLQQCKVAIGIKPANQFLPLIIQISAHVKCIVGLFSAEPRPEKDPDFGT